VLVSRWEDHLTIRRRGSLRAAATSAGTLTFSLPRSTVTMARLDAGVRAALLALDAGATPLAEAIRTARDALPTADLGRLVLELGRLYARGAFSITVDDEGETLCELSASSVTASFGLELGERAPRYRLSRFALLRREDTGLLAESLAAGASVSIRRAELGAVLVALREPAREADLARQVPGLPAPVLDACLRLLQAGGVIGRVDEGGLLPEDREPELATRDPHDLFIHNRSRFGLTTLPVGGTFRHANRPPLPAIRPEWSGRTVPLPRPDLARLMRTDLPLTAAMERRRSRREWADRPLSLDELGGFLYRVFRVRRTQPGDPADPRGYERTLRPIPSGGAMHDLEVYVAAGRIAELDRGLFHYHPVRHTCTAVAGAGHAVSTILTIAMAGAGCAAEPPAVVVLAARFGRLTWKYEGLAYAATLKNVGVAIEAMYLTATAMNLAGCALGGGDSASFALATGIKPYVESPVGEFMLGPGMS
jgi:oxazoline/thiazoline dehydrogenase